MEYQSIHGDRRYSPDSEPPSRKRQVPSDDIEHEAASLRRKEKRTRNHPTKAGSSPYTLGVNNLNPSLPSQRSVRHKPSNLELSQRPGQAPARPDPVSNHYNHSQGEPSRHRQDELRLHVLSDEGHMVLGGGEEHRDRRSSPVLPERSPPKIWNRGFGDEPTSHLGNVSRPKSFPKSESQIFDVSDDDVKSGVGPSTQNRARLPPINRSGAFGRHGKGSNGNSSPIGRSAPPSRLRLVNRSGSPVLNASSPTKSGGERVSLADSENDDDEPTEAIEQFGSSPLESPDVGKNRINENNGKGHVRIKDRMQRKDGTAVSRPRSPRSDPPMWPERLVKKARTTSSSNLPKKAQVKFAFLVDCQRLRNDRLLVLTVHQSHIGLFINPTPEIELPFDTLCGVRYCLHPPFVVLDFSKTSPFTWWTLGRISQGDHGPTPPAGYSIFLALQDENTSRDVIKALSDRMKGKTQTLEPDDLTRIWKEAYDIIGPDGSMTRGEASRRAADAAEQRHSFTTSKVRQDEDKLIMPRNADSRLTAPYNREKAKGKAKDELQMSIQESMQRGAGAGIRRSRRIAGAAPNYAELDSSPPPSRQRSPRLDRNDVLFPWPLQGRVDIHITKNEKYRLNDGDFLNDNFIEFGLKYVLHKASGDIKQQTHLFNSFFYSRLSSPPYRPKDNEHGSEWDWPAYTSVQKWTKMAKIFEKKYIIVPINESFHWFLAVIYNPGGLLNVQRRSSGHASNADTSVGLVTPERQEGPRTRNRCKAGANKTVDSIDPLDVMDEDDGVVVDDEDDPMQGVSKAVEKLDIEPAPQPIRTDIFNMFQNQDRPQPPSSPTPPSSSTKAKKLYKREPYQIWDSDRTWIMTFDSLGGEHPKVATNLHRWLVYEAHTKLNKHIAVRSEDVTYVAASVPQQPNFSDCGVFLIHYLKCLFENPEDVIKFIEKPPLLAKAPQQLSDDYNEEKEKIWRATKTKTLRDKWSHRIDMLSAEWNSLNDAETDPSNRGLSKARSSSPESSFEVSSQDPSKTGSTPAAVSAAPHVASIPEAAAAEEIRGDRRPAQSSPAWSTAPSTRVSPALGPETLGAISREQSNETNGSRVLQHEGVVSAGSGSKTASRLSSLSSSSPELPSNRSSASLGNGDAEASNEEQRLGEADSEDDILVPETQEEVPVRERQLRSPSPLTASTTQRGKATSRRQNAMDSKQTKLSFASRVPEGVNGPRNNKGNATNEEVGRQSVSQRPSTRQHSSGCKESQYDLNGNTQAGLQFAPEHDSQYSSKPVVIVKSRHPLAPDSSSFRMGADEALPSTMTRGRSGPSPVLPGLGNWGSQSTSGDSKEPLRGPRSQTMAKSDSGSSSSQGLTSSPSRKLSPTKVPVADSHGNSEGTAGSTSDPSRKVPPGAAIGRGLPVSKAGHGSVMSSFNNRSVTAPLATASGSSPAEAKKGRGKTGSRAPRQSMPVESRPQPGQGRSLQAKVQPGNTAEDPIHLSDDNDD